MERLAFKAKESHVLSERKAKDALACGNTAAARVHAEAAIRQKNEAMHYLRLQAQVEGAHSRMTSVSTSRVAVEQVAEATKMMEAAMPSGELERVAGVMDSFVDKSDQLDMAEKTMTSAFDESSAMSTPQNEVDALVRRIAEEHKIDTAGMLPDAPRVQVGQYQVGAQHQVNSSYHSRHSLQE